MGGDRGTQVRNVPGPDRILTWSTATRVSADDSIGHKWQWHGAEHKYWRHGAEHKHWISIMVQTNYRKLDKPLVSH